MLERDHPRLRGQKRWSRFRRSGGFSPNAVSSVSAWLRFAQGTTVSGDYSSVPDLLVSNPATESVAAQRPTAGTSTNGLTICTFVRAEPNQLSWPKNANTNSSQKWGIACWVKNTTYPALCYLFDFGGATAAYDNERINVAFNSSRNIIVELFGQDTSGYNGRQGLASAAAAAAGTWFWLRVQFDGTQGTEAGRLKIFVNEVEQSLTFSNVGTGGTPVLLRTNASSVPGVIGNFTDNTDTTYGVNGAVGPNIFVFSDSPTSAEATALMNFEAPT